MDTLISQHHIVHHREPLKWYDPVNVCIYCMRAEPEVRLTDEHIIADGLGGNLMLAKSSCKDCAEKTGWFEQQVLRHMLKQLRGALEINSRKRKKKQDSICVMYGPDDNQEKRDVPLKKGVPPFLLMFTNPELPTIILGKAYSPVSGNIVLCAPTDFNKMGMDTWGPGIYRFGANHHMGIWGQLVAKTAHAYTVAEVGINGFKPFLNKYILSREPSYDGYHISSQIVFSTSTNLHEISLWKSQIPLVSAIGRSFQTAYVVTLRIFCQLNSPQFYCVVGRSI